MIGFLGLCGSAIAPLSKRRPQIPQLWKSGKSGARSPPRCLSSEIPGYPFLVNPDVQPLPLPDTSPYRLPVFLARRQRRMADPEPPAPVLQPLPAMPPARPAPCLATDAAGERRAAVRSAGAVIFTKTKLRP